MMVLKVTAVRVIEIDECQSVHVRSNLAIARHAVETVHPHVMMSLVEDGEDHAAIAARLVRRAADVRAWPHMEFQYGLNQVQGRCFFSEFFAHDNVWHGVGVAEPKFMA